MALKRISGRKHRYERFIAVRRHQLLSIFRERKLRTLLVICAIPFSQRASGNRKKDDEH